MTNLRGYYCEIIPKNEKLDIISSLLEKCTHRMAEDSDGTLKAVVICEGDLHDPDFPQKFRSLLGKLKSILDPPKKKKRFLKVDKVCEIMFNDKHLQCSIVIIIKNFKM